MITKQKVQAFTIMELLVSMTLTAILVVFAFMGYNQIQKLFMDYARQSQFIADYNQVNKAINALCDKAKSIEKINDKTLVFKTDSSEAQLEVKPKQFLLQFKSHTDTFYLESKNVNLKVLETGLGNGSNMITDFSCNVVFRSQKFRLSFYKQYDAEHLLNTIIQANTR